jgi:(1->4)-alpha-D-glucan 1-alpha-D-glucosylmutase
MPGIPDVYQGTELWDFSLVDPDNRRPVDFTARRELLARLDAGWQPPVDASGAAKLLLTSAALRLRGRRPELFTGYRPVTAAGPAADHAVAFDRGGAVTVATRLPVGLRRRGGWGDTRLPLPPGEFTDVLTGRRFAGGAVALADLLDPYPVALLAARSAP